MPVTTGSVGPSVWHDRRPTVKARLIAVRIFVG
jgi:hypothetical protein